MPHVILNVPVTNPLEDCPMILTLELIVLLAAIAIGARAGGVGMGLWGGVGLLILIFVFGEKPGKIPGIPAIGDVDQPLNVLRRRPDIIAAERKLAASNERIGVAISDYYPKISLAGALGFDSINGGTLFNGKAFQAVGTGSLRWRLFDFGRVKAGSPKSPS